MKRGLKHILLMVLNLLGLNLLFKRLNAARMRVLMYHSVTSRPLPSYYWTRLALDRFTWQMGYVRKHYQVVDASELCADDQSDRDRQKHRVIITFDDGLENTYREAWPVLKKNNLTATVFVLPGLSESGERIWADELYERLMTAQADFLDLSDFDPGWVHLDASADKRAEQIDQILTTVKSWPHQKRQRLMERLREQLPINESEIGNVFTLMTKEQIIELAQSDEFAIGSHTDTHPILSSMSPDEQQAEIRRGMTRLKQWGVDTTPIFAYPNGRPEDFTQETIAALKRERVKAAVTTVDGLHDSNDDRFHIKRVLIGGELTRAEFKARLSGLYYFLKRVM